MANYLSRLRARLGPQKIIHPACRILIENAAGQFLTIERVDNGRLGLPAGALEEDETIEACVRREVREETGLRLGVITLIGISSDPATETVVYPNGDQMQYFTVEFYTNDWSGTLAPADPAEVRAVRFVAREMLDRLPENERSVLRSLAHYRQYGTIRLG